MFPSQDFTVFIAGVKFGFNAMFLKASGFSFHAGYSSIFPLNDNDPFSKQWP